MCLALYATGCAQSEKQREPVGAEAQTVTGYQPTLCANWSSTKDSAFGSIRCYAGKDIASAYKAGIADTPKDYKFVAITIESPPTDQPTAVKQFFDQARAVSKYFQTANALADIVSNTASELRAQCDRIREWQKNDKGTRDDASNAIIDGLETQVLSKLEGPKKTEQAKLSSFREKKAKAEPIISRAQDRLSAIGLDLKPLVKRHKEYLATEKSVFKKLEDIATRGSNSTIVDLGEVQQELIALESKESPICDEFEIDVRRLQARVGYVVDDYVFELGDLSTFLSELKLDTMVPNAAAALIDTLLKIGSYCESRQPKFDEAYASILEGLKRRAEALVQASANAATQKVLADARFIRASTDFLASSSARSARLATLPISSRRLKLPYLFAKYREHEATIALEPICIESGLAAASFMDAGCEIIKKDISKSRRYISISVPAIVKTALPRLKTAGVDAAFVDGIAADLAAKRYREAVQDYDMAVSLSEKVVQP
jgi:hypothetical protein